MPTSEFNRLVRTEGRSQNSAVAQQYRSISHELADSMDMSGGVTQHISAPYGFVLCLDTAGAVDFTVEISPDYKNHWFEIPESPLSYSSATQDVILFDYSATHVRVTASDTQLHTAILHIEN